MSYDPILNRFSSAEKVAWTLEPLNSMFFTWPELTRSARDLEWTIGNINATYEIKLTRSSNERFKFALDKSALFNSNSSDVDDSSENDKRNLLNKSRRSKAPGTVGQQNQLPYEYIDVSCVSYVEGTQRVVVFTTDPSWAEVEQRKEASTMEIFLNLKGMQVSLINNNLEIAVVSVKDSNSIWSLVTPGERKIFANDYGEWLEHAYSNYLADVNENTRLG